MVDHSKDPSGQVLREVELAREGRVAVRHAPFAEHQLRIPVEHWYALLPLFPGLDSRDHDTFEAAYHRLLESPLADPYRVRKRRAQLGHL